MNKYMRSFIMFKVFGVALGLPQPQPSLWISSASLEATTANPGPPLYASTVRSTVGVHQ
jgi:hypothetical protein